MKIKNIFIEAFRCFDYQSLDFEIDEDRLANLIVLYAPNGFGKTSLFDAIEFGMTGSVNRFMKGMYAKDNREDKKLRNSHSFLFNKNVDKDRKIRIGIHFDGTFEDLDCSFDVKDENFLVSNFVSRNNFFKDVILSQEWFDYFIRSTSPEDRCKIFFDYFGDKDDLLAYNKELEDAKTKLKSEKTRLESELKKLKNELKKEVIGDAFDLLKQELVKISANGLQLPSYDSLTPDSLQVLLVWEKAKQDELCLTISTYRKKLDAIHDILNGTSELVSMEELEKLQNTRESLKIQLKNVNDYLLKQSRLLAINKKHEANVSVITRLKAEKSSYEFYIANESKISNLYVQLYHLKEDNQNNQQKVGELSEQIKSLQSEKTELLKQKNEVEKALSLIQPLFENLASIYQEYRKNISEKEQNLKNIKLQEELISELRNSNNELTKRIQAIDLFRKDLQKGIDESLLMSNFCSDKILSLLDDKKRLLEIEKGKSDIDNKKKGHELYKSEVQRLVDNSKTIYSELENGVCPLCGFDWKSVEKLINSIENNRIIDDAILHLSNQYDKLSKEAETVEKCILDKKNELLELVKNEILAKQKQIADNEIKIGNLNKEILKTHDRQVTLEESISKYADRFRDYEYAQIKELVDEEYCNSQGRLSEIIKKISEITKGIEEGDKQLQLLLKHVKVQNAAIANIQVDSFYLKTKDCYRQLGPTFDFQILEQWKEKSGELEKALEQIYDSQKEINREVGSLHLDGITEFDNEAKVKEQKLVDAEFRDVKLKIGKLVNSVNVLLCNKISVECSPKTIEKMLHEEFDNLHTIYDNREKVLQQLERLSILIKNAEEYLGYRKNKAACGNLEETIDGMKKQLDQLQQEKDRLSAYVKKYVDYFFDKKLINKLYNTIDPHPKYKQINFDCDFDKQSPRLYVKMGTVNESAGEIIPNLYFSSAQINILSFCIFMAKALNAKYTDGNVDCIFIDDPIQAMDDINVLSVVDLLRNVAFGNDKQVVITTHDRNFYELLKKKCPSYIFDSKFFKFQEKGLIVEDA